LVITQGQEVLNPPSSERIDNGPSEEDEGSRMRMIRTLGENVGTVDLC
jgi:hypothetical protein